MGNTGEGQVGKFHFLALAMLVVPASAQADWQYTKWGMTPAQVIAASKGAVTLRKVKDSKGVEKEEVGGIYKGGDRTYDASFTFKGNKLVLVNLQTSNANSCRHLTSDLNTLYGKPIEESAGMIPIWVWNDKAKGNQITATGLIGDCLLQYQPLPTAKDTGL